MSMPKIAKTSKIKSPFPDDFLKKIQETLLKQKAMLEADLAKFAKKDKRAVEEDFDSTFPNYGDSEDENAREVADYEANLSIEHDMEKTLRDVNAALGRITKGTYGICKYCKKPIDKKRLSARPTSSADVDCKKAIKQEI